MKSNPKRWLEAVLPRKRVQQAATLLNEQCWCWGADIRYPDGNLLLTYGFRRERAPSPTDGSSMYTLMLSPIRTINLWGWGLFYTNNRYGGLFIGRNGFAPMLTTTNALTTPIFSSSDLPSLQLPITEKEYHLTGRLMGEALCWMAQYEQWVVAQMGEAYRLAVLTEWRKRPVEQIKSAAHWATLGEEMEEALLAKAKVPVPV